mmetsp:Transcript_14668/g.40177  ORF Transcript_14668/g.40177 Transcript_14668/m.40177 type:complete len:249 (+) Transcript_14668:406-1152(+)
MPAVHWSCAPCVTLRQGTRSAPPTLTRHHCSHLCMNGRSACTCSTTSCASVQDVQRAMTTSWSFPVAVHNVLAPCTSRQRSTAHRALRRHHAPRVVDRREMRPCSRLRDGRPSCRRRSPPRPRATRRRWHCSRCTPTTTSRDSSRSYGMRPAAARATARACWPQRGSQSAPGRRWRGRLAARGRGAGSAWVMHCCCRARASHRRWAMACQMSGFGKRSGTSRLLIGHSALATVPSRPMRRPSARSWHS